MLIESYPVLASTVHQTEIGTLCTIADEQCVRSMFGTDTAYEQARRALAAHLTVLVVHRVQKHGAGAVGPKVAHTDSGGNVTSFGQVQTYMGESMLASTPYGVTYTMLKRSSFASLPMVF